MQSSGHFYTWTTSASSHNAFEELVFLLILRDDCKSIQIKRGPGRPRKRKYFGAGSKGGKSTPTNPTTVDAESSKSDAGVPELQFAAPDIKTPVTDVSVAEPTKKKKKKASSEAGEKDERPEDCSEETLRQPSPKNNEVW